MMTSEPTRTLCTECGEEMHRFAVTAGPSGWSCDRCGAVDDDPEPRQAREDGLSPSPDSRDLGSWPALDPRRWFVDGARWWEFRRAGATMWQSDRNEAEAEAERRHAAALASGASAPSPDLLRDQLARELFIISSDTGEREPQRAAFWDSIVDAVPDATSVREHYRRADRVLALVSGAPATGTAPEDEAESVRCSCEWQSPEHGRVDVTFPAELDPQCRVHGAPAGFPVPAAVAAAGDREGPVPATGTATPPPDAAVQAVAGALREAFAHGLTKVPFDDHATARRLLAAVALPTGGDAPAPDPDSPTREFLVFDPESGDLSRETRAVCPTCREGTVPLAEPGPTGEREQTQDGEEGAQHGPFFCACKVEDDGTFAEVCFGHHADGWHRGDRVPWLPLVPSPVQETTEDA